MAARDLVEENDSGAEAALRSMQDGDPASAENVMTVRDDPTAKGQIVPRAKWHFADAGTVALDGGFEPGRIYDVVYRSHNPKVVGVGLAGTRDLVSFFKHDTSADNPAPGAGGATGSRGSSDWRSCPS